MKIMHEYQETFNAADLGTSQYSKVLPLNLGWRKATRIGIYVSTSNLDNGGAATNEAVSIAAYSLKTISSDPSDSDKRQIIKMFEWNTGETAGANSVDVVTSGTETDIEKGYHLGQSRYDKTVYAPAISLKISNGGDAWAGGTVTVDILVFG